MSNPMGRVIHFTIKKKKSVLLHVIQGIIICLYFYFPQSVCLKLFILGFLNVKHNAQCSRS